jgi:hypothetical protein
MTARWLLEFERQGGLPPRDDESLRIAADGSFVARRTIGGAAIGSFEGVLGKAVLGRLSSAIDALGSGGDLEIATPRHGATEVLQAAGRTIRLGSNEVPPKPWRGLVDRVRKLVQGEVLDSPRAAVTLTATARTARIVHAGTKPLDVNLGSVTVSVVHLDDHGLVLGRWGGRLVDQVSNGEELVDRPEWVTAAPGWSASLPFGHGLLLGSGDWLQVRIGLELREGDTRRAGRLYAPVLADG